MSSLKSFLYFAYGSNLLTQRIHINNPSAVRKTIGKLRDYRLDFNYYSRRWKGCAATIVPDTNSQVWGAVWEIDLSHMECLDNQEGVSNGVYKVIHVNVITLAGEELLCRAYELNDKPPKLPLDETLPLNRRPSKVYLDTIIAGAIESKLPDIYVSSLKRLPHNGYDSKIELNAKLNEICD